MKQFYLKEYPDDGSGIPQIEIRPMGNYNNLEGFRIVTEKELASIQAKLSGGSEYIEPPDVTKEKMNELEQRIVELESKITAAKEKQ